MEQHADALLVHIDALFNDGAGQSQIIALAEQHRLPTMMATANFPARGGLISYGADTRDLNRQAGVYAARILRGENRPTCLSCSRRISLYGSISRRLRR